MVVKIANLDRGYTLMDVGRIFSYREIGDVEKVGDDVDDYTEGVLEVKGLGRKWKRILVSWSNGSFLAYSPVSVISDNGGTITVL